MAQGKIIAGIEIGTAKVAVVVGEIVSGAGLNIIGFGSMPSQGIKKGEILDFELASAVTHAAIREAEKAAQTQIEDVYISQTGAHLVGFFNEGSVNVMASDNAVSKTDIDKAIQEAKAKELPKDCVYIHHIQNPFKLDGRVVENPLGMAGRKLSVGYWSIYGNTQNIKNHMHIVNGYGLRVEDMIISSIAAGSMVVTQEEKENGILVIDMGRGTIDFVIYKGGYVIKTGVLPVGGDHITNDISLGLRIDRAQAERLKIEEGRALMDDSSINEKIILTAENGTQRSVSKHCLQQIIYARMEEVFTLIRESVSEVIMPSELTAGCVLTGGTSRLSQVDELARQSLGLETRLGINPSWAQGALKEPEYSVVLGLLHYALKRNEKVATHTKRGGILSRVAKVFNL